MTLQHRIYAGIGIATLALAFLLNPSADRHREKIKESVAERSQLESMLGIGQLAAFTARYKSLGVASYTTVNGEMASFGVLGMVFFIDRD